MVCISISSNSMCVQNVSNIFFPNISASVKETYFGCNLKFSSPFQLLWVSLPFFPLPISLTPLSIPLDKFSTKIKIGYLFVSFSGQASWIDDVCNRV